MTRAAVIGIDLGTQSTKAVVVSADGQPLSNVDVPVTFRRPQPGWAEQDPHVLEESALKAIGRAVRTLPTDVEISGISVAAQMGGCIGIDEGFSSVTDHEMWLDTRADADRQEILSAYGDRIFASNGIIPFVAPRVRRWLRLEPSLSDRLTRVLAPGGYVIGRLTDARAQQAICDRTQANLFGCFDAASGEWDTDLAGAIGLPPRLLPRLVESSAVVGTLSATAAERCGLRAGIPVTGGMGDGTGGWLAAGGLEAGVCIDTGGSSDHFAVTVQRFMSDPEGIMTCMPSAAPGRWYLLGFTTGTGITHRWLTELVGKSYDELEERAAALFPGAGNLLCIAHMHGRVTPYQPDVRGAFVGFDDSTTDAHLYRALLESIAYEAGEWVRDCRRLYPELQLQTVASIG